MRKIVAQMAISFDGYIEGPVDYLDLLTFGMETNYANNLLKRFDTIFFGRKTYQRLGFPRAIEGPLYEHEREFNTTINNMRKYVFTNSLNHVQGNGMVIGKNITQEVERIRDEVGKDIWLYGGANVIRTFAALDLIDEYLVAVHPVNLNDGKPLRCGMPHHLNLALKQSEMLNSGMVILNFEVN
jgi:dihydrofolate reductase